MSEQLIVKILRRRSFTEQESYSLVNFNQKYARKVLEMVGEDPMVAASVLGLTEEPCGLLWGHRCENCNSRDLLVCCNIA